MGPAMAALETMHVNATNPDNNHCFLVMDAISLCTFVSHPSVASFSLVRNCVCRRRERHPACWPPTFPMKGAATVSEPSTTASGNAASRRGAGPNTTRAPSRGSYSELWHGHLKTFLSRPSPLTQSVTGQPACAQIAEYDTMPSAARARIIVEF